ncbi:odorant receptor Or2-like [Schistocerca serialis cubense]|uniref:odorant receptor Or2-like n=1 Tax=Schistocerca serialis cubense TaxID=2023355 RepID=UPI00214EA404|nr:odorant receptor Or2-like [Schistocerca serialis cubense]
MPFSWSSSGRSVLKLNIRHLWLFGVWPLGNFRLFELYVIFVFALGIWNFVEGSLAVSFSWRDLEATTLVLTNTFTMCSGMVKMAFFTRDRWRYNSMARRVDSLMLTQKDPSSSDPALENIVHRSRRRAGRLTLGMLLFMASQGLVWFPMPLIAHPGERRLPFVQHPWDNTTSYYELSYAVQCLTGMWMAEVSFGMDCLFATIMILVAAQLEVLALRIGKLRMSESGAGEGRPWRSASSVAHDKMYSDLCLCIESHQEILRFVRHLNGTMNPIAMTQFVFSVLVACLALFQATYSADITAVIRCVSFLPIPGGQVYLYCWAAHHVTEQAEAVSTAAYGCSWVDAGTRFKHALRILISRAQKPLILTAGYIYPINREAFLSVSTYKLICCIAQQPLEAIEFTGMGISFFGGCYGPKVYTSLTNSRLLPKC